VNKIIIGLTLLISVSIVVLYSFKKPTPLNINQVSSTSNLKYFGYYNYDYPEDPTNNFNEIKSLDNTNIAFADLWSTTSPGIKAFTGTNIKAIISVDRIFFEKGPTGKPNKLIPNWATKLMELKTYLLPYMDSIYGFYMSDEPIWNDISKADFNLSTKAVADTFPGKAILAVEAYPPIESQTIPAGYFDNVTDIGFDYYFTMYHPDNQSGWTKYTELYNKFKPFMQNKKIWIIPDGYSLRAEDALKLPDALDRYYNFARSEPGVVGMLVYSYGTGYQYETEHFITPDSGWNIFDQNIRNQHIQIGKSIIQNSVTNALPTGNIESIKATGLITGWAADPDIGNNFTQLHFYLDGTTPSNYIGKTSANFNRPDVYTAKGFGQYSGFEFQIPLEKINDGNAHTLYPFVINKTSTGNDAGENSLLGNLTGTKLPVYTPEQFRPGDLTHDGKVNLYDYVELLSHYGTMYNDSDFINIVANYDK